MANDHKGGIFSSLFGRKRDKEAEEAAELEAKQRIQQRIEQALAEVETPALAEEFDLPLVAEMRVPLDSDAAERSAA